jgi:hypothetical protein
MKKFIIPAAAAALTLVGTAAMAQPYGYYGDGGYSRGYNYDHGYRYGRSAYRDSDRDGIPDRAEWNRDRDRDGRPDQWDRYDNRRGRHHRHHRHDNYRYGDYRYGYSYDYYRY